jgi:hypothetical protein
MPIVKYGSQQIQIPFDAQTLAELIYQGAEVYPDANTPPEQLLLEHSMIDFHLNKLWGDQTGKTTEKEKFIKPGAPGIWDSGGKGDFRLPSGGRWNYQNFEANPFINYKIREIQPYQETPDLLMSSIKDLNPILTRKRPAGSTEDPLNVEQSQKNLLMAMELLPPTTS